MWPFKQKSVVDVFNEYTSPHSIAEIAESAENLENLLQKRHIEVSYMLIEIQENDMNYMDSRISQIVEIISCNKGLVISMMSSFVFATFTIPFLKQDEVTIQIKETVDELMSQLGENIKIIYGSDEGLIGNMGTTKRMQYGLILSSFISRLDILLGMPYGTSQEINDL